jgi:hypothetical protein
MKKLIAVACWMISCSLMAQVAKPIQFRDEIFDFGQVVEANGPVTHQFEFTNISSKPITILVVKPSCGCTTPDWTKGVIQPGKTGFIQARFDPKGRPGYFSKSLAVTTDADPNPLVLQIKGTVTSEADKVAAEFDGMNGNWRVKTSSFNLGKIFRKNEFVIREFPIMNAGKSPVKYMGTYDGPAYIRVSVEPATLAPGATGVVKLGYNGKLKNEYGFQSDNVVIHTDDVDQPKKSFSVYATLEDYFPTLTPEEISKAPKLVINETTVDFGRIKQNQPAAKAVSVTNSGKATLELRAIQGNCTCISTTTEKKTLKAGESTTIVIAFNPQARKGTQQKAVTLYSNDPQNPVQRITFTAYAE